MIINFKDSKAEKNYYKANKNIQKSLQYATDHYDELSSVKECHREYDHPMNDIPVNTDTCMAAFGDMLETPIPERVLIYTVGKRSRRKPVQVTCNLEYFKWYLTTVLGMSISNVNGHSSRYWVNRESLPGWLLEKGVFDSEIYESNYLEYIKWMIDKQDTLAY